MSKKVIGFIIAVVIILVAIKQLGRGSAPPILVIFNKKNDAFGDTFQKHMKGDN